MWEYRYFFIKLWKSDLMEEQNKVIFFLCLSKNFHSGLIWIKQTSWLWHSGCTALIITGLSPEIRICKKKKQPNHSLWWPNKHMWLTTRSVSSSCWLTKDCQNKINPKNEEENAFKIPTRYQQTVSDPHRLSKWEVKLQKEDDVIHNTYITHMRHIFITTLSLLGTLIKIIKHLK